ncbi:MAG: Nif3-like dinuclear metal center hexameric protein [Lachnospiraceae bacterium]|nr:Nif3-like dinuclear metal center hexameric protein [Lachnospiraceae bacterium]
MKITEVIEKVKAYHPDLGRETNTDVIKYGDPKQECTGIVVTCFASSDVLRKAKELGANLVIAHEPLFWTHADKTDWLEENPIFHQKKQLLDDGGIVVWRDHDLIHGPGWGVERKYVDGIFYGIMKELGWEQYVVGSTLKPLLYKIPTTDATTLGLELKEKLGLNGIRIVGDPHAEVSTVFVCEHVNERGGGENGDDKIRKTMEYDADALIPLELIDWTLSAFVRDSTQLGRSRVIYNTGHFNLEELGMKYLAKCLPDVIGEGIQVTHVPSGDAFDFII